MEIGKFVIILLTLEGVLSLSCKVNEYRTFVPVGQFELDVSGTANNTNIDTRKGVITEIDCQKACDSVATFECITFSHSSIRQECQLYSAKKSTSGVKQIVKVDSQHYEGICSISPNLENCGTTSNKVDLCFVVDISGSICDGDPSKNDTNFVHHCNNWLLLKRFMKQIINQLDVGYEKTRVALVTFGNVGSVEFKLTKYTTKTELFASIDKLEHKDDNTNTREGLYLMRKTIYKSTEDRLDAINIAFVITDGVPTVDINETDDEALQARNDDVIMYSVGITDKIDVFWLKNLSSSPHELNKNYFTSPNFDNLSPVINDLLSAACIKLEPQPEPTSEPVPTGRAEPASEPESETVDVFYWLQTHPEYAALIGMGIMIVLLFITVIVVLCCYTGGGSRSNKYKENKP